MMSIRRTRETNDPKELGTRPLIFFMKSSITHLIGYLEGGKPSA
jgi:hypothetical protein